MPKKLYINKIEGWMSRRELNWLYDNAKEMGSVVEIGSWKGRSTHALLSGCKGIVTAIDHFKGTAEGRVKPDEDLYATFIKNVGHFKNLKVLRMDSLKAAQEVLEPVEMIFIDGDHSFEAVKRDIETWLPKTTKLICGHDFQRLEVKKAIFETLGEVENIGTIWYRFL